MITVTAPVFFPTEPDYRRWLEANHDTSPELLVGFWKQHSGKLSIDWPQARDQDDGAALSPGQGDGGSIVCFGWIDGDTIRNRSWIPGQARHDGVGGRSRIFRHPGSGVHLPSDKRLEPPILGEVAPGRVCRLDKRDFPFAKPTLDRFLAADRRFHPVVHFEPNQALDAMPGRESLRDLVAVLVDSAGQVGRHTGVGRPVERRTKQINARQTLHAPERGRRWTPDQVRGDGQGAPSPIATAAL